MFEVSLKDKNCTNVYTYQALSYDDYKAWFAIMEGKELTPVLSTYSIKSDPICNSLTIFLQIIIILTNF